jgi:hypothetical protein
MYYGGSTCMAFWDPHHRTGTAVRGDIRMQISTLNDVHGQPSSFMVL